METVSSNPKRLARSKEREEQFNRSFEQLHQIRASNIDLTKKYRKLVSGMLERVQTTTKKRSVSHTNLPSRNSIAPFEAASYMTKNNVSLLDIVDEGTPPEAAAQKRDEADLENGPTESSNVKALDFEDTDL